MNLTVFTKNDPCNGKPWKQWPAKPAPVRDDDTCLHVADLQRAMLIEDADRRICEALGFHAPVFYSVACELRHIYWDRRDPSCEHEEREFDVLTPVRDALQCHGNQAGQAEAEVRSFGPLTNYPAFDNLHVATLSDDEGNTTVLVMLSTETVRAINTAGRSYCARHPRKGGRHV